MGNQLAPIIISNGYDKGILFLYLTHTHTKKGWTVAGAGTHELVNGIELVIFIC